MSHLPPCVFPGRLLLRKSALSGRTFAVRKTTFLLAFCLLLSGHVFAAEPVKNVVFIISDDLRASVLGCYGDAMCTTPNIDRLASRGVVFERAYCQGTVCGPSRASLMRGRYYGKPGITLGEHFIAQGRVTARVGKIFHMRVPGDIIAGTHGDDVEACWSERYNAPGLEAHTPGDYACLNLNIFTTALENRQSTGDPHTVRWSYMRYTDGTEELYDMQADPNQYTNLAKHSAQLETLSHARTQYQLQSRASDRA